MPDDQPPPDRCSARILLLDERDRILLFRTNSRVYGHVVWITPGGGLEDGESHEDGARRELWEETGSRVEIGPCVWHQRFEFTVEGRRQIKSERFYVARCASFDVSTANWTDEEREDLTAIRWWSQQELSTTNETFVPPQLRALLPAIIAGTYPAQPIDCGA